MTKLLLTLKIENKSDTLDMEITSSQEVSSIISVLCEKFSIKDAKTFGLYATPPGRQLDPNETLEDAGVWNGTILTLRRIK